MPNQSHYQKFLHVRAPHSHSFEDRRKLRRKMCPGRKDLACAPLSLPIRTSNSAISYSLEMMLLLASIKKWKQARLIGHGRVYAACSEPSCAWRRQVVGDLEAGRGSKVWMMIKNWDLFTRGGKSPHHNTQRWQRPTCAFSHSHPPSLTNLEASRRQPARQRARSQTRTRQVRTHVQSGCGGQVKDRREWRESL